MTNVDMKTETLRTRECTEYEDFLDIRETWNEILAQRSRQSVFLRHEWIDAAWQWCRIDHKLRLICCYGDANLTAIAPFCSIRLRRYFVNYNQLSLIEVPDTQECDIVVADKAANLATCCVVEHLRRRRDWDIAILPKLEVDGSLATHAINASKQFKINCMIFHSAENPEVDLNDTWEAYYATRSRRLKKGNNNVRNKIYAGDNNVNLRWSANFDKRGSVVNELISGIKHISSISWKKDTGLTLNETGPGAFIDSLTQHATENDWLSLWTLEINDSIVATEYQLIYDGVVVALRADYDPSYAHLSPGTYLNWQLLQTLFDSGNRLYRMGAGSNPYKLRWANHETRLVEIRLYNRTIRGMFFWLADAAIKPALRAVLGPMKRIAGNLANAIRIGKDRL